MKIQFKKDKFKKARGGRSKLFTIHCAKCDTQLCYYQKDGPGILKRMYLDRISGFSKYANLEKTSFKNLSPLACPSCKETLGVPMIYKKEGRGAFRLFAGAVSKKAKKLSYR